MTKTHRNLFEKIVSFENLYSAARRAQLGKGFAPVTARFNHNLEKELFKLQEELSAKAYKPGEYFEFYVFDPKKRLISAAPYRDRVVHHALCAVIEPIFERTFVFDSYACRVGKGQHNAASRFTSFSRKTDYVLKFDISQYFASVDHEILKGLVRRKISCKNTLWLIDLIIDSGKPQACAVRYFRGDDLFTPVQRRKGIPIGNLTSQLFANVYLNPLDHFMKEKMGCREYIRYMDDIVVFSDDRRWLLDVKNSAIGWLGDNLRLWVSERKCSISPARCGTPFLGYVIFPGHRRLKRDNVARFKRRMRKKREEFAGATLSAAKLGESMQSWIARASHADTHILRSQILNDLVFVRECGQSGAGQK